MIRLGRTIMNPAHIAFVQHQGTLDKTTTTVSFALTETAENEDGQLPVMIQFQGQAATIVWNYFCATAIDLTPSPTE